MTAEAPSLTADVVLHDGSTVRIRPARRSDAERVEDYLIGLSPETRRLRFWGPTLDVSTVAAKIVDTDDVDHLTLLVLHGGDGGTMIGGAQYIRTSATRAEISLSVTDTWQGRGIGSILLGHLAQAASRNGITTFSADVLPENHAMINVFRQSGFHVSLRAMPGAIEVEFPTSLTDEAIERFDRRETEASVAAIRSFLEPSSVAVIGASRDPSSIGGRLFRNLLDGGFRGPVHPVNPHAEVVHGVPTYPSVTKVPGQVDLAFVVVQAASVLDVARECAEKGVRGIVVISSGFGEVGEEGVARQRALVDLCRDSGVRLIGPNCMGLVNTDPRVGLNGTFADVTPPPGHVAFLSQSGAIGLAVMEHAAELGLGLSSFVSVGNKADISGNDLIAYWADDPRTDVILLYLESFGNPRRFGRLAREVSTNTPIVAVKSGRTPAGVRATASHTGAIVAASDVTVDALFRQAGVIRTETLEEMFEAATLLANQPVPKGDGIAIVTNAGGLGIQCADACEANGTRIVTLTETTIRALRSFLPGEASVGNPVDMIASASGEDFRRAIATVATDPGVDALIVIYIPPEHSKSDEITRGIVDGVREIGGRIPVATSFMSSRGLPDALRGADHRIPSFPFPEQAAIAMARACAYGRWRARRPGAAPTFTDVQPDRAAGVIAEGLGRDDGWLDPDHVLRLLECYGIPLARSEWVGSPDEVRRATDAIGGPVAVKAIGAEIVHKSDVGGVRLGLASPDDAAAAAAEMAERIKTSGTPLEGFLVQEMVPGGVEMLVGVTHDPLFGPLVAVSSGGTAVELVRDVAVRLTPITDVDASEMIRSLRTFPLLDGYRGAPKADAGALEEIVIRVGAMVETHPEISEMDCNPVTVLTDRAVVLDARIRVQAPPVERPLSARDRVG